MNLLEITKQVLAVIKSNNMEFVKIGYNHLRGKLAEIKLQGVEA